MTYNLVELLVLLVGIVWEVLVQVVLSNGVYDVLLLREVVGVALVLRRIIVL